jgi:RsiW-degrading membrane proteinase PrsW (M82 family)
MDIIKWAEKLMSMDEKSWQRHANPWSVYSRFTTLPLLSLAFYSREWMGMYSLIPIVLAIVWIWLNPRLFNAPSSTDNWASMGTFGERLYLNRKNIPIPDHHQQVCMLLQTLSALGIPFFIYSLYSLNVWLLIASNIWIMVFKAWFVDRMVWLYREMKNSHSKYASEEKHKQ